MGILNNLKAVFNLISRTDLFAVAHSIWFSSTRYISIKKYVSNTCINIIISISRKLQTLFKLMHVFISKKVLGYWLEWI